MLHREAEEHDRERELDRTPHNEKTAWPSPLVVLDLVASANFYSYKDYVWYMKEQISRHCLLF